MQRNSHEVMQGNLPEQETKQQETAKPKEPKMSAEERRIRSFMEFKRTHPQSSLFSSEINDFFEKKEKEAAEKSKTPSLK